MDCPVCLNIDHEPKRLSCKHTVCVNCIQGITEIHEGIEPQAKCPLCRRFTPVPNGLASNLPTNLLQARIKEQLKNYSKEATGKMDCYFCDYDSDVMEMKYCRDCDKYICTACAQPHKNIWEFNNHRIEIPIIMKCKHNNKCEYFCTECDMSLCRRCLQDGICIHQDKVDTIEKLKEPTTKQLHKNVKLMKEFITNDMETLLDNINTKLQLAKDTKYALHMHATKLILKIKSTEKDLVAKVEEWEQSYFSKKNNVDSRKSKRGLVQELLNSTKEGLKGEAEYVMITNSLVKSILPDIMGMQQSYDTTDTDITFIPEDDISIGKVNIKPTDISIPLYPKLNKTKSVWHTPTVQTPESASNVHETFDDTQIRVTSSSRETVSDISVGREQPQIANTEGIESHLHGPVNYADREGGEPIQLLSRNSMGSVLNLQATFTLKNLSPVCENDWQIFEKKLTFTKPPQLAWSREWLRNATDVLFTPQKHIFVCDHGDNNVIMFDCPGKKLTSSKDRGVKFDGKPWGLTYDKYESAIIVGDKKGYLTWLDDKTLSRRKKVALRGVGGAIYGVGVMSDRDLVVGHGGSIYTLSIYDRNGKNKKQITQYGPSMNKTIFCPWYISVRPDNVIVVTMEDCDEVVYLSRDLECLQNVAVKSPRGCTAGPEADILVASLDIIYHMCGTVRGGIRPEVVMEIPKPFMRSSIQSLSVQYPHLAVIRDQSLWLYTWPDNSLQPT